MTPVDFSRPSCDIFRMNQFQWIAKCQSYCRIDGNVCVSVDAVNVNIIFIIYCVQEKKKMQWPLFFPLHFLLFCPLNWIYRKQRNRIEFKRSLERIPHAGFVSHFYFVHYLSLSLYLPHSPQVSMVNRLSVEHLDWCNVFEFVLLKRDQWNIATTLNMWWWLQKCIHDTKRRKNAPDRSAQRLKRERESDSSLIYAALKVLYIYQNIAYAYRETRWWRFFFSLFVLYSHYRP